MATTITSPAFTYELVKCFKKEILEQSIETQDILYLINLDRINELKADIARYIIICLDDKDGDCFMWNSSQINKRIDELCSMGATEAVCKFIQFGYWT